MKVTRIHCVDLIRWTLVSFVVLFSTAAWAQTGGVRGRVVDQNGQPVEGARVLIEYLEGVTRTATTTTNEKGDFIQVGLRSGNYRVTLRKKGYETALQDVQVQMGSPKDMGRIVMEKLPEGALSQEELQKLSAEIKELFDQGAAAVEAEDYRSALDTFQKAADKAPELSEAHYNMGFVYRKLNDMDNALSCYEKAVEARPDYYDAWVAIGNIHNDNHTYGKALEAFQKAIAIDSTDVSTLYNYGAVAVNAGDIPKAQEAFGRVLEIERDHALANYQMGMVFVNQGKNEEAIIYLEKYLELDPEGAYAATAEGVVDYLKKS